MNGIKRGQGTRATSRHDSRILSSSKSNWRLQSNRTESAISIVPTQTCAIVRRYASCAAVRPSHARGLLHHVQTGLRSADDVTKAPDTLSRIARRAPTPPPTARALSFD
eukprot:3244263-Prymnesium_polylepis.1